MPTYEYRCDACGATYELFQKMSDPPLETCEACGSPVRKVLYPVAIHFKGSGFYTTDYGRSGARRAGKGAEGEGEKGDGESSGGEPAGTAAKTAAKGDGAASGASSAAGAADGARKKEKQPAG
ncbi:MAG: FmdB family zinc ribbon protein [Thermoleophilia bacterium]|nr:FmdB family zinc ribbon protein [Thermoleophilia bacterium]